MDFPLFWSEMMMQHQLFLRLLLADYSQKVRARNLERGWKEVLLHLSAHHVPVRETVAPLLERTISFQSSLLNSPLKSLYLSPQELKKFLHHITMESDYFLRLLEGTITPEEEINFLAKENSQHDHFISSLLSGPNFPLKEELEELSQEIKKEEIPYLDSWINLSNQALQEVELDVEEGRSQVKSPSKNRSLPLAMVEHEKTEGKWEKERLDWLAR